MNQLNPFQTPYHVEEEETQDAALLDPTRPRPLSILSILALAWCIAIVVGSLTLTVFNFIHRAEDEFVTGQAPTQVINMALVAWQIVLLGFWVAVGGGRFVIRSFVAIFILGGVICQLAMSYAIPAPEGSVLAGLMCLTVISFASLLDLLLLAVQLERGIRRLVISLMKVILPALLVVGVNVGLYLAPIPILFGVRISSIRSLLDNLGFFGTVGTAAAAAGIFLLLWKHGLRKRWYFAGAGIFLLGPLLIAGVTLAAGRSMSTATGIIVFASCIQVACLTLYHAAHRMLRSFGGSLVPMPPAENPKPTADN